MATVNRQKRQKNTKEPLIKSIISSFPRKREPRKNKALDPRMGEGDELISDSLKMPSY